MKERKPIINSTRAILKQNITYLEQILVNSDGELVKLSQHRENGCNFKTTKQHPRNNGRRNQVSWKQWVARLVPSLPDYLYALGDLSRVISSSNILTDWLTDWLTHKICLWLRVFMQSIRPKNVYFRYVTYFPYPFLVNKKYRIFHLKMWCSDFDF